MTDSTTNTDLSTNQVISALSVPAQTDRLSLNRRHFLQAAGAVGAATMLPAWLADEAAAATPIGPADGVLVVVTMAGGNDGLNTVVPINDGAYYAKRPNLNIDAASTLPLDSGRGLHPTLTTMHGQWQQGNVAILEGVGHPNPDLSHFTTMGRVMYGHVNDGLPSTGWLGRYMDGLGGSNPFDAVTVGHNVPLTVIGANRKGLAVPRSAGGLFSPDANEVDQRQYAAIHTMGASATGLGEWGDALAVNGGQALTVANQLVGAYGGDLPEGNLVSELTLCARLINANLGVRVLHVLWGDFDSHDNQPQMHGDMMAEFEAGMAAFYATLSSTFAGRTMMLVNSEFGRRIESNNSAGTDHGAANTWFAIGAGVKGGRYGAMHSMSESDDRGNIRTAVDFRNVYANVLDRWLDADGASIVGANFADLGFLHSPASGGSGGGDNAPVTLVTNRQQLYRLYLAYFLRMPDEAGLGFWQREMNSGRSLAAVSEAFALSPEFSQRYGSLSDRQFVELVYQNVLGRQADAAGLDFWTGRMSAGESRGRVMVGFSESPEYIAATKGAIAAADASGPVARLYFAYFLREPDDDGMAYWHATGLPLREISQAFSETPEFRDKYGVLNDDGFIRLVYQNVLERQPDAGGLAYWKTQLRSGITKGDVMVHFSESAEFVAKHSG